MITDYRYPGSRSFQDTDLDRKLFFGRDTEKDELLHLILAEKLVVLFAKSGMGKTSLLNAGVLQPLRERGFFPVNVRLNDPNLTPLQTIYAAISTPPQPSPNLGEGAREGSLLQYFTNTEFWSKDDILLTPVLIFDQFEEFFAFHKAEDRQTFITQLAEALKGQTAQPLLKVIIALREDALGQLKDLSAELPDIFRNLFRLDYLPRAQARQAIIAPAQLADETIGMHTFQYAPDAVDAMLDFLCKQQQKQNTVLTDEVEPAQLQLLCQHVEQNVRKRQQHADAAIVVQKTDLGGERGMQKIVQQFYDRQLKRLRSFWQRRKVRKLCEKGLLSKTNRRLSLAEEDIGRRFRVSPKLLAALIDSRLLRAENRGSGRVYYELSHDTLILPIRKSQRRHKIKSWIVRVMLIFLLLISPFFFLAAIVKNYQVAKITTTCLTTPEKMLAQGYNFLGLVFQKYGKYADAEVQYKKASTLDSMLDVNSSLGSMFSAQGKDEEAIALYQQVLARRPETPWVYVALGRDIFSAHGKYEEAITHYQKAIELDPTYAFAYQKLGDTLFKQGKFDEAKHTYSQAYLHYSNYYYKDPNRDVSLHLAWFALCSLMVERIEQAYMYGNAANQVVNKIFYSRIAFFSQDRIIVRFCVVACQIYQKKRTEALTELQALLTDYRSFREYNEKEWDIEALHNVISMSDKLTDADKTLLLKLIDVLQAPKAAGDQKLKELEAMLPELLKP